MPLHKTRTILDGSQTNSDISEASSDRLATLEQREKSELQQLDEHLSGVAHRIVDVEKGLDTDFVTKFVALKGEAELKKLFYYLSSTSPNRGFRMLRDFAQGLTAPDVHKAIFQHLDTDHSFLVKEGNMKFTKYSIQVRRQEIVDHVIELIDDIDQHSDYSGTSVDLSNTDKSSILESMMAAWKLPEAKKDDVYHALMISMRADHKIRDKSVRDAIQSVMENGPDGKLTDLIDIQSNTNIQVLTGGGFLDIPHDLLSELEIKFTAEYDGRIYAMMKNGCEGNLIIIENGQLKPLQPDDPIDDVEDIEQEYSEAMQSGKEAITSQDYADAKTHFQTALEKKPSDPEAQKGLDYVTEIIEAETDISAQKHKDAIDHYEKAKTIDPSNLHNTRAIDPQIEGLTTIREEKYDEHIQAAEKHEKPVTGSPDYAQAKSEYQKAIDTGWDDGGVAVAKVQEMDRLLGSIETPQQAYIRLLGEGDNALVSHDYALALDKYREAKTKTADQSEINLRISYIDNIQRGDQHLSLGEYKAAFDFYTLSKGLANPGNYNLELQSKIDTTNQARKAKHDEYFTTEGLAAETSGDYASAKSRYEKARDLAWPADAGAAQNKMNEMDRLLTTNPGPNIEEQRNQHRENANAAMRKRNREGRTEAIDEFGKALALKPDDSYSKINKTFAHGSLAKIYESEENRSEAKKHYDEMLKLDPNNREALQGSERMKTKLESSTTIDEGAYRSLRDQGDAMLKSGDYDRAITIYQDAKTKTADQTEIDKRISYTEKLKEAKGLADTKDYKQGIDAYEEAKTLDPTNPHNTKIDETLATLRENQEKDYRTHMAEGQRHENNGDFDVAKTFYQLASDTGFEDAGAATAKVTEMEQKEGQTLYSENMSEGDAALVLEQYDTAKGYYQLALNDKPSDTLATNKIAYVTKIQEAGVLLGSENYGKKVALYQEAIAILPTDPHNPIISQKIDVVNYQREKEYNYDMTQGWTEEQASNREEARDHYQEAHDIQRTQDAGKAQKKIDEMNAKIGPVLNDEYSPLLSRGDTELLSGNYGSALLTYQQAKNKTTDDAEIDKRISYTDKLIEAEKYLANKDYSLAKKSFEDAVSIDNPNNYSTDQIPAKIQSVEQARKGDYDTHTNAGDRFMNPPTGDPDYQKALDAYQSAVNNGRDDGGEAVRKRNEAEQKLEQFLADNLNKLGDYEQQRLFREAKTTMTIEEARAFIGWINAVPEAKTINLKLDMTTLLYATSGQTRRGSLSGTTEAISGKIYMPTGVQLELVTKIADRHTINVPNLGLQSGIIELKKKHYNIDVGLFTGNYNPNYYITVSGSDDKSYIRSMIRRTNNINPGVIVYLPPYDHDKSGGTRTGYGRVENPADVWKGYYAGDGGRDVTNHIVITTEETDLEEAALTRLRLIPTSMLELPRTTDLQDVSDIDRLMTGKSRRYREAIDDLSQRPARQAERQRILDAGFIKGGSRVNITNSLGIQSNGLNLGLINLRKEHTNVSQALHTDREGKTDYTQTKLYRETQTNPLYKIDYLGQTLSQYKGNDLALGLSGVRDPQILTTLFTHLRNYQGTDASSYSRLTLGVQDITSESASRLNRARCNELSFRNNPCGGSDGKAVMDHFFTFLRQGTKKLHFYSFDIDALNTVIGSFDNHSSLENTTIAFDAISWDDLHDDPATYNKLISFPGTIVLGKSNNPNQVELRDGKARKNGEIRYESDSERLSPTERESKTTSLEDATLVDDTIPALNYTPQQQKLDTDSLPKFVLNDNFDPNTYVTTLSNVQSQVILAEEQVDKYKSQAGGATQLRYEADQSFDQQKANYLNQKQELTQAEQSYNKAKASYDTVKAKVDKKENGWRSIRKDLPGLLSTMNSAKSRHARLQSQFITVKADLQRAQQARISVYNSTQAATEEYTIALTNQEAGQKYLDQYTNLRSEGLEQIEQSNRIPLWLVKMIIPSTQLRGVSHQQFANAINRIYDQNLRKIVIGTFLRKAPKQVEDITSYSPTNYDIGLVMQQYFGMEGQRDGVYPKNERTDVDKIGSKTINTMVQSYHRYMEAKEVLEDRNIPRDVKAAYMRIMYTDYMVQAGNRKRATLRGNNFFIVSKEQGGVTFMFSSNGILLSKTNSIIGEDLSDARLPGRFVSRTPGGGYMLLKSSSFQADMFLLGQRRSQNNPGLYMIMAPLDNQYTLKMSRQNGKLNIGDALAIHPYLAGNNGNFSAGCVRVQNMMSSYDHAANTGFDGNKRPTSGSLLYVCRQNEENHLSGYQSQINQITGS